MPGSILAVILKMKRVFFLHVTSDRHTRWLTNNYMDIQLPLLLMQHQHQQLINTFYFPFYWTSRTWRYWSGSHLSSLQYLDHTYSVERHKSINVTVSHLKLLSALSISFQRRPGHKVEVRNTCYVDHAHTHWTYIGTYKWASQWLLHNVYWIIWHFQPGVASVNTLPAWPGSVRMY